MRTAAAAVARRASLCPVRDQTPRSAASRLPCPALHCIASPFHWTSSRPLAISLSDHTFTSHSLSPHPPTPLTPHLRRLHSAIHSQRLQRSRLCRRHPHPSDALPIPSISHVAVIQRLLEEKKKQQRVDRGEDGEGRGSDSRKAAQWHRRRLIGLTAASDASRPLPTATHCSPFTLHLRGRRFDVSVVLLGEGRVGKTCLCLRYVQNSFSSDQVRAQRGGRRRDAMRCAWRRKRGPD